MLSRGCELNLPDGRPRDIVVTPLQFAILNDSSDIAGVLLQHGHDPNFASRNCAIPLIEAIKYNRPVIGGFAKRFVSSILQVIIQGQDPSQ